MVQPAPMMAVVNMVLKKVVESLEFSHTDRTETSPMMDVNVVLTMAFLADEKMSRQRLVSVHMDLKQLTSESSTAGHKDQLLRQSQLNKERVHLTMALEAVACKADNGR